MPTEKDIQLRTLEAQLSQLYVSISEAYKRMSKLHDNFRLDVAQSGIDLNLAETKTVRSKIDILRAEIMTDWEAKKNNK